MVKNARCRFRIRSRMAIALAVCVLFAMPSAPRLAAEVAGAEPVILAFAARSLDAAPNQALAGIIELAAGLQLEREGIECSVIDRAIAARGVSAARDEAAARGAAYLVLAEFSEDAGDLVLDLSWFEGGRDEAIARISRRGPEDMLLDDLIFRAFADLVAEAERVSRTLPARSEREQAVREAVASEAVPSGADLGDAAPTADDPAAATAALPRGLALRLGAGPFLAGGSAGQFFDLAGGIDCRLDWHFPGRRASLGAGLYAAAWAFKAEGPLESSLGLMAPLAAEIGFELPGSDLRPALRLAAGAAILYMRTELYGDQAAALPFAAAGIGLTKVLGSGLGISLDISFAAILDGPDLIWGLVPGLGLSMPIGRRK
jgi:hypothetical protein